MDVLTKVIPTPPTNCLYRYVAITGVWFLFFSILILWLILIVTDANDVLQSRMTWMATVQSEIVHIDDRLKAIAATSNDSKVPGFPKFPTVEEEQQYLLSIKRNDETMLKNAIQTTPNMGGYFHTAIRFRDSALWWAIGMMVLSLVLGITGFVMWYKRAQKYTDGILKAEYEKYYPPAASSPPERKCFVTRFWKKISGWVRKVRCQGCSGENRVARVSEQPHDNETPRI